MAILKSVWISWSKSCSSWASDMGAVKGGKWGRKARGRKKASLLIQRREGIVRPPK
jgi:hypothetical protein